MSDAGTPAPESRKATHDKVAFRFCREWYILSNVRLQEYKADTRVVLTCSTPMRFASPHPQVVTPTAQQSNIQQDRLNNVLLYRCRTCQATESATNYCVFRNVLGGSSGETAGVITDIGSDPTLPRSNKACPYCNETQAVFFQSQQRTEDTKMVSSFPGFSYGVVGALEMVQSGMACSHRLGG